MSTFQKADETVTGLASELIATVEAFKWIKQIDVHIDYVFAYGARNDDGELIGDAIKHHGVRALGLCRIVPLKDRAMGRGDAEIVLDHDWWSSVDDEERKAVLDHELTHLKPGKDSDDLGRPKLKLRKHDFQFGWFNSVAERNGEHSQERIQAQSMFDLAGQYYWPSLVDAQGTVTIKTGDEQVTMSHQRFSSIVKDMAAKK